MSPVLQFALLFGVAPAAPGVESRPNVVIILTDDQGYGEFSCHGNPLAETPNIDRLAAEAVRLTDFHVAPMCTPTRGQLLTGLDACRNGATNVSSGRSLLRADLPTLADRFAAAGYRTGIFGKWHLGDNYPFRPIDRGFGEALWFPSSHVGSVPDFWNNDDFSDVYLRGADRRPVDGYCTDVFFNAATEWIARGAADPNDRRPFLAYIPLNAAHTPLYVPGKYREPVRAAIAARPEILAGLGPRTRENVERFLAMGANIDENVGRFDAFLKGRGLYENTIVLFLTDNGSTFGPRYYNAGMRGKKTEVWEGGHRVPCFVRWPAGQLAARDVPTLTQVQDLLPTLGELAGVEVGADELDGASLAPLLRNEPGAAGALADRTLVINYSRMPTFDVPYTDENPAVPMRDGAAVLWKRWRLLWGRELYNLDADPLQTRDLAAERPEIVARLNARLDDWWEGVKEEAVTPRRIVVGDPAENPARLTACEWLDVFVDQQTQVRAGTRKDGVWHLTAARPGRYRFAARRWPAESGLKLDEPAPPADFVDGGRPAGVALPIAAARLRVESAGAAPFESVAPPDAAGREIVFEADLPAGPLEVRATFLDAAGAPICGAYYLEVKRSD